MTYFSVSSLYSPILQEKSTICDNTCKGKDKNLCCYLLDISGFPAFLWTKAPTRGPGGQNTVICMKLSTWALKLPTYPSPVDFELGEG